MKHAPRALAIFIIILFVNSQAMYYS